jgi:hypothetical protein
MFTIFSIVDRVKQSREKTVEEFKLSVTPQAIVYLSLLLRISFVVTPTKSSSNLKYFY